MINTILSGKYYITELVGSGGMANVYKARVLGTSKIVAIKVLKDEFAQDREFVRRFRSEAQAVLYLSHENIVHLVDVGKEDDKNYIVLEFVEGKTLKQLIRERGRLDEREAIQIAIQICDALTHAHERGIIHRDIKPQNILMTEDHQARIADFGIARRADASTMTFSGTNILGSVHYLSPEQARGVQTDAKSDIYSLGIVLYEMVTGTVPFDSENSLSVAIMHLQEEIAPPNTRNTELGRALNDIILKATQKEKRKRYNSAKEVKRDLLRALKEPDGTFVEIDDGSATARIKKQRGKPAMNIFRLALAMIVVLGLLVALFIIGRMTIERAQRESALYIPQLLDKTVEEAAGEAAARGFEVVVRSEQPNDNYPKGRIFSQEPRSGAKGKVGDTILVDVSGGPSMLAAPELIGAPLEEVQRMLEEWDLELGEVVYEYSDQPEGTVIRQMPEVATSMQPGDMIDVWVSGIEGERDIVPSLVDKSLEDALSAAEGAGFSRVLIRTAEETEDVAGGRVMSQMPQAGELVLSGRAIEIWISPYESSGYSVDAAYNVDVTRKNSQVLAIFKTGIAEYVFFEEVMSDGRQAVPMTITSQDGSDGEIIIYVDGEEVRREAVSFTQGQ